MAEKAIQQLNMVHVLVDPTGEQDRPLVVRRAKARMRVRPFAGLGVVGGGGGDGHSSAAGAVAAVDADTLCQALLQGQLMGDGLSPMGALQQQPRGMPGGLMQAPLTSGSTMAQVPSTPGSTMVQVPSTSGLTMHGFSTMHGYPDSASGHWVLPGGSHYYDSGGSNQYYEGGASNLHQDCGVSSRYQDMRGTLHGMRGTLHGMGRQVGMPGTQHNPGDTRYNPCGMQYNPSGLIGTGSVLGAHDMHMYASMYDVLDLQQQQQQLYAPTAPPPALHYMHAGMQSTRAGMQGTHAGKQGTHAGMQGTGMLMVPHGGGALPQQQWADAMQQVPQQAALEDLLAVLHGTRPGRPGAGGLASFTGLPASTHVSGGVGPALEQAEYGGTANPGMLHPGVSGGSVAHAPRSGAPAADAPAGIPEHRRAPPGSSRLPGMG